MFRSVGSHGSIFFYTVCQRDTSSFLVWLLLRCFPILAGSHYIAAVWLCRQLTDVYYVFGLYLHGIYLRAYRFAVDIYVV